jgi:uncharacterized membrane protein YhaH (DUF805 family)
MTATAPAQFGKRGVKIEPLKKTGPDMWTAHAAAVALGSATRPSQAAELPSIRSLAPSPASPDAWQPDARPLAADGAVGERPALLTLLFSSRGRIGRQDYWVILTLSLIGVIGLAIVLALAIGFKSMTMAMVPVCLAYLRIRGCARIKRWHDRDKSAVWLLVGFIPFVGWIWSGIECGFLPGTPGPNRFGAPPR